VLGALLSLAVTQCLCARVCARVFVCVCVCVRARACVRARVCAHACVYVRAWLFVARLCETNKIMKTIPLRCAFNSNVTYNGCRARIEFSSDLWHVRAWG